MLAAAEAKTTTLLQWFDLNKRDPSAHQYLYQDIPAHYTWNKSKKHWNPCQRYTTIGVTIGRMYQIAPSSGKQFYLQLLLTAVTGAQSFQHLHTVNNAECATFKEACIAMGLLENDNEWRQCLQEAAIMQSGAQLQCKASKLSGKRKSHLQDLLYTQGGLPPALKGSDRIRSICGYDRKK